jgi:membrane-bound lytic murein transglycosylase D
MNALQPTVDQDAGDGLHQVKASDTLYSVARQYGVTIKELMEWNDKKDFSLSVGEKLKVRSH